MQIDIIIYVLLSVLTGMRAAVESKNSLRFFAFGDWGGIPFRPYKTFVEMAVGKAIGDYASEHKMDFVLALGDNFYLDGVKNVDDPRFNETYERVFNADSLQIPWFVVAGNHDHYGNVSAQIAYTEVSKRWNFPDYYYTKSFVIPSSNSVLDIIMIDTILLCGNVDDNNVYDQPILEASKITLAEQHWKWLEQVLKMSSADYLLVCGHFPVYSIAEHGSTKCLVNRLQPLLVKYNVSAFFSGHDHNLQHIQPLSKSWRVEYFVSGSTNLIDSSKKHFDTIPSGSLKYHWGNPFSLGAYIAAEVTVSNMTVFFIESAGKHLYEYAFLPRFTRN